MLQKAAKVSCTDFLKLSTWLAYIPVAQCHQGKHYEDSADNNDQANDHDDGVAVGLFDCIAHNIHEATDQSVTTGDDDVHAERLRESEDTRLRRREQSEITQRSEDRGQRKEEKERKTNFSFTDNISHTEKKFVISSAEDWMISSSIMDQ